MSVVDNKMHYIKHNAPQFSFLQYPFFGGVHNRIR